MLLANGNARFRLVSRTMMSTLLLTIRSFHAQVDRQKGRSDEWSQVGFEAPERPEFQGSKPLEKGNECPLVIIAQSRLTSTETIGSEVVPSIDDQIGTFAQAQ